MDRPLSGLRVLDLSHAVAGPYAARMLSDMGADVVKLESPKGDSTRLFGVQRNGISGFFAQYNAGKRNICLDLRQTDARNIARELASRADILIENFRPGVLERLGLGYAELVEANPRLLMLSITGFGDSEGDAERAAYAPVIHAEVGLVARQAAHSGSAPSDLATSVADYASGLHGLAALLAALAMRSRTGRGQHVHVNLLDAMLATDDHAHFVLDGAPITVLGGEIWDAPGGPIMLGSVFRNTWNRLRDQVGLTDPAPRDATLEDKIELRRRAVGEWILATPSRDDLIEVLEAADIAWAEVRTAESAFDPERLERRGMVARVDDGAGSTRNVIQSPYTFSSAESGVSGPAARRGQHNREVLADWLDASASDIAALELSEALVSTPALCGGR